MDIVIKALGLLIGFYVFRGLLGKARDGDLRKFLILVAVTMAAILYRLADSA
ncbi:hypothetical protein [Oryzomicrobium sp.]|uniref:hypothetical protein n=1 Tax=Oryzomicrobium sp. TaxID=1911578 RepID=UPI002FE1D264